MNKKRFALACVAVFVLLQALNFLIHQLWLSESYGSLAEVFRAEDEMMSKMPLMMFGQLVWSVLFCYVFVRGYENKGPAEGLRYGLLIGLFFNVAYAIDSHVVYPIPGDLAIKWFVTGVFVCTILGLVTALIYKPAD